jgi:hypothetical protein
VLLLGSVPGFWSERFFDEYNKYIRQIFLFKIQNFWNILNIPHVNQRHQWPIYWRRGDKYLFFFLEQRATSLWTRRYSVPLSRSMNKKGSCHNRVSVITSHWLVEKAKSDYLLCPKRQFCFRGHKSGRRIIMAPDCLQYICDKGWYSKSMVANNSDCKNAWQIQKSVSAQRYFMSLGKETVGRGAVFACLICDTGEYRGVLHVSHDSSHSAPLPILMVES